jgi:hypothetical protein
MSSTHGRLLTPVIGAALCVMCALPAVAGAATVFDASISGRDASASFAKSDGCIESSAHVDAVDGTARDGHTGPVSTPFGLVVISRYDHCTNWIDLAFGFADLLPVDFSIDSGLKTAVLNTTIEVVDVDTGVARAVTVGMTWNANANPFNSTFNEIFRYPDGSILTLHSSGVSRPAIVSGTVVDGDLDYAATAASSDATISSFRSGGMSLTR